MAPGTVVGMSHCVPWMFHCVADSSGIQAFSCHQGLSIMLEREEPPPIMGTRFSWGQQEQLGMGATLVWWHLESGQ